MGALIPGWTFVALHAAAQVYFVLRALLLPHREPASRMAWVVVIIVAPIVGMVAYALFGEINIGRSRIARMREAVARLPPFPEAVPGGVPNLVPHIPHDHLPLFRVGRAISGFPPVGGNRARLLDGADATIDAMVADIDAAAEHVHLAFYIWLPDGNGRRVAAALRRAAARGVACRAMADDLGSRLMIRAPEWQEMQAAGVRLARALPIGNPLLRALKGRIDLRNHRKIVVVDNRITYCGSQNCADAAFLIKAKYAPWVDAMMRFEGPVARQAQHLFAGDWMAQVDEDLTPLLREPLEAEVPGFAAQVIGTGPTVRYSAMPEMFEALMYAAQRELCITTPYYVPDEGMQGALCASARRGVATAIVLPKRNDSRIVAAASRSYYRELLEAGVRIFEFSGGLLHAKTLTLDGVVTLIGSANLDRRSFHLNYENNILLHDAATTGEVRRLQARYIAASTPVEPATVAAWSTGEQIWNNAVAMFGPVL
jgi:cardiolipin synthase